MSHPPRDPFHPCAACGQPESPDRKEIFRLGTTNYDVISLRFDHYRAARRYGLCLNIATRRQHFHDEDLEGEIVEEVKQALAADMDV